MGYHIRWIITATVLKPCLPITRLFLMTILGRCSDSPMRERIGLPLVFLCLVGAVALGCDMIARPQRHLRGYMGGEMHREWKKTEIQILGILVIGGACLAIYAFISEFWTSCFG